MRKAGGAKSTAVTATRPDWVGPLDGDGPGGVSVTQPVTGGSDWVSMGTGAQAHVDAYLEYHRIVGDADGGTLFTPAEYDAFKAKARNVRGQCRLYVSWRSKESGVDCTNIGPQTKCICGCLVRGGP